MNGALHYFLDRAGVRCVIEDLVSSPAVIFSGCQAYIAVLYQVLNKQVPLPVPVVQVPVPVPVPNLQVPVPVQVLCINYWHSGILQLHKVKVVVSFII